jgi:predicted RNase H-like HicB family nuclease
VYPSPRRHARWSGLKFVKGSKKQLSRYIALVDGKAGAYGVVFPELDGCVAMGATVDEALANATEALRDWIEVTEEHGERVASPQPLEKLRRRRDVAEALAEGAVLATVPLKRVLTSPHLR